MKHVEMREEDHLTILSLTGYQDCWNDTSRAKPSTQKDLQYNSHMNWSGIEAGLLWLRDRRLIAKPCRPGIRTEYITHEVN